MNKHNRVELRAYDPIWDMYVDEFEDAAPDEIPNLDDISVDGLIELPSVIYEVVKHE